MSVRLPIPGIRCMKPSIIGYSTDDATVVRKNFFPSTSSPARSRIRFKISTMPAVSMGSTPSSTRPMPVVPPMMMS